jgi:hypothetical protein
MMQLLSISREAFVVLWQRLKLTRWAFEVIYGYFD